MNQVISQSTTPMAIRMPAIMYCSVARPVHGPTRYAQHRAPMIGSTVGARKCLWSTESWRSTRQQMLTTVNTASSSSAVVPPSDWLQLASDEEQQADGDGRW